VLVVCLGTATEVGKTWVGAATLAALRSGGHRVSARKPAQSHDPVDGAALDAEVLAAATGEAPGSVCRPGRTYPAAMAPPIAAEVLGQPVPTMAELLQELRWPDPPPALRWVEAVGGPRSPLAADGDGVDLVQALAPDEVVLVADAGLGTINAVLLCVAPLRALGVEPLVVLNRFDAAELLHRRNATWLQRAGVTVLEGPTVLAAVLDQALAAAGGPDA
jgi:dethiobiotin synthetase